jgi:hypothetical protein
MLLGFALISPLANAQSGADAIRVEVHQKQSSERKEIKGSMAAEKTETVTLEIGLSGKAKDPETRVVKWAIFGKETHGNDIKVLEAGEDKVSLDAHGQQKLEDKSATTTSTPDHTMAQQKGGKGGAGAKGGKSPKLQKVEGTGAKFAGWGVQVKDGDKVVGEEFSGLSLKPYMK